MRNHHRRILENKRDKFFFSYSQREFTACLFPFYSMLDVYNTTLQKMRSKIVQVEIEQNRSDPAGKYGILIYHIDNYPTVLHEQDVYFQDQFGTQRITYPAETKPVFFRRFRFNERGSQLEWAIAKQFETTQFWAYRESLGGIRLEQIMNNAGYFKENQLLLPYKSQKLLAMFGWPCDEPKTDKIFGIHQELQIRVYTNIIDTQLSPTNTTSQKMSAQLQCPK